MVPRPELLDDASAVAVGRGSLDAVASGVMLVRKEELSVGRLVDIVPGITTVVDAGEGVIVVVVVVVLWVFDMVWEIVLLRTRVDEVSGGTVDQDTGSDIVMDRTGCVFGKAFGSSLHMP